MRCIALLLSLAALGFGLLSVACTGGEDAPVLAQQTQPPSPTKSVSLVLPQVARDGPAGTFKYTVKAGDTLFSLAQTHGTTVAKIAELNGLGSSTVINVGQVLVMPIAPTPTPVPTATPVPPAGPSRLVTNGPRNSGQIALTFDMGGRVDPALDIVNFLIANNVHATIFMTGEMVDNRNTDYGRQVLQLVKAHPELFELGSHSYSHPDFTTLTAAQIAKQLGDTEASIARVSGLSPRPLFRPPFGAYNQAVLATVGPLGYSQTIMWDIDTIDWRPIADGGPTPNQIVTKVVNNAQGGSIVLMHLGGYETFTALPALLQGVLNKGLTPVTVGTLIGSR